MLQSRTDAAYDGEPATGISARRVDGPMHDEAPGVSANSLKRIRRAWTVLRSPDMAVG